MKSKTSFYNPTVLKNDITRFFPVWALYTVGFLMMLMLGLTRCENEYQMAQFMQQMMTMMLAVNGLYAMVVSQVLFGDLLNPRMCYALHAMPLTRDDFFCTHTLVGFGFSLIPNAVVILASLLVLGKAAPTAMYLYVASAGMYLFYFSTALLAIQLAGNRIAAVLIYGLLNFTALLPAWFAKHFYEPMMYGVTVPVRETFLRLCPTADLMEKRFFHVVGSGESWYDMKLDAIIRADGWGTLGIWTIVGLVVLAAAQMLYRRRKLEVAGDLVAYKSTRPVFMVLFTVMVAGFFHLASSIVEMGDGISGIVFTTVGIAVGWIVGLMLLERQVKVFRVKSLLPIAVMAALFLGSVALTVTDAFHVVNKVPELENTESITVSMGGYSWNKAHIRDAETMSRLRDMHIQELSEYQGRGLRNTISGNRLFTRRGMDSNEYSTVTLEYNMKNGSKLERTYNIWENNSYFTLLQECANRQDAVFGMEFDDLDDLAGKVEHSAINLYTARGHFTDNLHEDADFRGLLEAIAADAEEGHMASYWWFHRFEVPVGNVNLIYNVPVENADYYIRVHETVPQLSVGMDVFLTSKHTLKWMIDHDMVTQDELDEIRESEIKMKNGEPMG